jgi:hypothetical protein
VAEGFRPASLSAPEFLLRFREERIRVVCACPPGFEDQPELPSRIRGAWGREMYAVPPEREGMARPYDVLFGAEGDDGHGRRIPKPYAVGAKREGDVLVIELSLFGSAVAWADPAREALLRALWGGVKIRQDSRMFVVPEPLDCAVLSACGIEAKERASWASLAFDTPYCVKRGRETVPDVPPMLMGLVARVAGLMRWHGAELAEDFSRLKAAAEGLRCDASRLRIRVWRRYRRGEAHAPLRMEGMLGTLYMEGALSPFVPYLAVGSRAHLGYGAALGLGRYRLGLL